jgi:hypothetical protein
VAHAAGVSRSTIQTYKNRLTAAVHAFMGPELRHDLQRPPQWRVNLRAVREKNGVPVCAVARVKIRSLAGWADSYLAITWANGGEGSRPR